MAPGISQVNRVTIMSSRGAQRWMYRPSRALGGPACCAPASHGPVVCGVAEPGVLPGREIEAIGQSVSSIRCRQYPPEAPACGKCQDRGKLTYDTHAASCLLSSTAGMASGGHVTNRSPESGLSSIETGLLTLLRRSPAVRADTKSNRPGMRPAKHRLTALKSAPKRGSLPAETLTEAHSRELGKRGSLSTARPTVRGSPQSLWQNLNESSTKRRPRRAGHVPARQDQRL